MADAFDVIDGARVLHRCGPFSHQHVHHLNPSQFCIEDARFYSSIERVSRAPPFVETLCSLTKSRVSIHRCNRLQKLKRKKTSTRGYPRRRRQSPGEYNPNRSLYAVILIAHTEARTPQLSKQSPPPTTRPVRPHSRQNPTARAPRPTLSHPPIRSTDPQNPQEKRRR